MGDRSSEKERARSGAGAGGGRQVPKDAAAVTSMLKEMGVQEYDPRVLCQLLEFAYRYVSTVLEDARAFAAHAKKKTVEADDVRLAAGAFAERAFTAPPPREVLLDLTRCKNLAPLPLVKPHCGLRLPPDRYCLSACNYRLARARRPHPRPQPASKPPVKPQPHQNLVIKKPATLVTVSKTQTVSVPKPVFKFSSAGKQPNKQQRTSSADRQIKTEPDDSGAAKRKREDDDYDVL